MQDTVADMEEVEVAAQRVAQQKRRFLNALTDTVDQRDAFEPTTYAEILQVNCRWQSCVHVPWSGEAIPLKVAHVAQDYRWMFAQSPDGLDEAGVDCLSHRRYFVKQQSQ